MSVLIRNARVLTMGEGPGPRRGPALADLGAIDAADVLIKDGRIARVGAGVTPPPSAEVIDAAGRVLMPAFVDAHTHACWAGERYAEWAHKLAGATYLEILERGGGIMSTVRSVRTATLEYLTDLLVARLNLMLETGTTAVEVKFGYGLDTKTELKMLRAIAAADQRWPGRVRPTACIGHALDPDHADPVARTVDETLPAVSAEFPGITIDAYCETGAWSLDDCLRLFDAAAHRGHPIRVHADQFNDLGMIPAAVTRGFRSVDHLEATSPEHLRQLAESDAFGVVLPCSGFHLDQRYADARAFVDAGGALALATNLNPGSAPAYDLPTAIAMGVRFCGLTPAEAIAACTVNAADLLGYDDLGRIAPGTSADLILLRHTDEIALAHDLGGRHADLVLCNGEAVFRA